MHVLAQYEQTRQWRQYERHSFSLKKTTKHAVWFSLAGSFAKPSSHQNIRSSSSTLEREVSSSACLQSQSCLS